MKIGKLLYSCDFVNVFFQSAASALAVSGACSCDLHYRYVDSTVTKPSPIFKAERCFAI